MKGEKRVSLSFSLALSHAHLGVSLREPGSSTLLPESPGAEARLCVCQWLTTSMYI